MPKTFEPVSVTFKTIDLRIICDSLESSIEKIENQAPLEEIENAVWPIRSTLGKVAAAYEEQQNRTDVL